MYAEDFEYDGRYLSDYGFVICDIGGGSDVETVSAGGTVTIQTVRHGIGRRALAVNAIYENCIEAEFTIAKNPCDYDDQEVTDDEERDLMRWLNRRTYRKMRLLKEPQNDDGGCYYNAAFNIDKIRVDGRTVGYTLHMTTDSPFGHGERIYNKGKIIGNDDGTFLSVIQLEDANDDIGYIYPDMELCVLTLDTDELIVARKDLADIEAEITEMGIDTTVTVFGNIDTDNRQVLEWTESNLAKYRTEISSWGESADDLAGSVSTVFGASGEYDGVEIAFSPILQTEDGPVLLSADTVDDYIFALIEDAGAQWSKADLLALDETGTTIGGKLISKLIADVGNTAVETAEAMHYVGKYGALSLAQEAYDDAMEELNNTGLTVVNNVFPDETFTIKDADFTNVLAKKYAIDGTAMTISRTVLKVNLSAYDKNDNPLTGVSSISVLDSYLARLALYHLTNELEEGSYRFVVAPNDDGKKCLLKKLTADGAWETISDNTAYTYSTMAHIGWIGPLMISFHSSAPLDFGSYIAMDITQDSTKSSVVGDMFNYNFIRICNTQETRTNIIACNCPCVIKLSYEPIIKLSP